MDGWVQFPKWFYGFFPRVFQLWEEDGFQGLLFGAALCFADSGPSVALLLVAPDSGQMQHGALEITGFLAQRDSLEPLSL